MHMHIHKTWDNNTSGNVNHTIRRGDFRGKRNNAPVLHRELGGNETAVLKGQTAGQQYSHAEHPPLQLSKSLYGKGRGKARRDGDVFAGDIATQFPL